MSKRLWIFLTCLFISASMAFAQKTVTGVVIDKSTGEPVIGATVRIDGTSLGMATDVNGKFTINNVPESAKLIKVSYVGMEDVTVAVKQNVRIIMEPISHNIDEIMVIAYGTQKKSAFTGSASELKAEDIEAHVATNVTSALAGTTPGVQFMAPNGDPTSNAGTIRVRGFGSMSASNAPLIILDGAPYDGGINSINPQDVESMTTLKDAASTAIYGARGANGVILITTKRGRVQDAEIKFDARWGSNSRMMPRYDIIDNPGQYYETAFKQLYYSQIYAGENANDAYLFANANLYNEKNGGLGYQVYTLPDGQNLIGRNLRLNPNAKLGYSNGTNYYTPDDWYDETFHNAFRQEYNVSMSGVHEKLNYFTSAGYLKDGGLVDKSGFQRYTGRMNVEYNAKEWLRIKSSMGFTHRISEQPSYDTDINMSSGNLFYITNIIGPIYPLYVRNADGSIKYDDNGLVVYDANQTAFKRPSVVGNAVRDNALNVTKQYSDLFNGNWAAIFTPVKGLNLTANMAITSINNRTSNLYSRFSSSSSSDGAASVSHGRTFTVNNQYLAEYTATFGEDVHHLNVLGGYEQYRLRTNSLSGYNDHLFDPFNGELSNADGTSGKDVSSSTNEYMTEGFLARAQYDYMDKYFVSASFRRDASSRFAPGHRWGSFGSIGLAWLINKEKFFNADWVDMLKFKISYGTLGNDDLGSYYPYADQYSHSYNEETGDYNLTLVYKGNPELTWETSKTFNTGFDFELFKGRLGGTLEFFSRKTVDLLYDLDTPLSSGNPTGSYPINVGSIRNTGIELSLDGIIMKTKDFEWKANLNLTHYKNKITSLHSSVAEDGIKGSYTIRRVDGSLYQSYMYKTAGVIHQSDLDASKNYDANKAGKYSQEYEKQYTQSDLGKEMFYVTRTYEKRDNSGNVIYKKDAAGNDLLDKDGNKIAETYEAIEKTSNFSEATRYDCGTTLPDIYGGFGTSIKFKGFDLGVQIQFQFGGKFYDGTYQSFMHTSDQAIGSTWHKDALNAWSPDNPDSNIPRLDMSNQYAVGQSAIDRYMTTSDYISFNNVTLGYTLPKYFTTRYGISSLRVYVAGENLGVISARKGMDPRFSVGTGSYVYGSGSATNYYAMMRSITAGLTITF